MPDPDVEIRVVPSLLADAIRKAEKKRAAELNEVLVPEAVEAVDAAERARDLALERQFLYGA